MKKLSGMVMTAFAVLSFLVPAQAMAGPPIGSRIDRSSGGLDGRFNPRHSTSPRPGLSVYLRCTASLNRSKARNTIDAEYGSREQVDLLNKVQREVEWSVNRSQDCFTGFGGSGVEINYSPITAVGSFSEYFILNDFEEDDVADVALMTPEDWKWPGLTPRNGSEMISLCVAQARGDLVVTLIETEPAGDEEMAAIQELVPYLGACLTDGIEVSFDAPSVRAMLAHGLYRSLSQMEELRKASS